MLGMLGLVPLNLEISWLRLQGSLRPVLVQRLVVSVHNFISARARVILTVDWLLHSEPILELSVDFTRLSGRGISNFSRDFVKPLFEVFVEGHVLRVIRKLEGYLG